MDAKRKQKLEWVEKTERDKKTKHESQQKKRRIFTFEKRLSIDIGDSMRSHKWADVSMNL